MADAIRAAAIPIRPAWADSDPRWRRRVLAGIWVLVFLPLMDLLAALRWDSRIPVPAIFDFRGSVRTLNHTFLSVGDVYPTLVFFIGMVLLFAKERGRRRSRWDWTRRWGVLGSCVVLLLSASQTLFLAALVLAGIAAVCLGMPIEYQPALTPIFVHLSSSYLLFSPYPSYGSSLTLSAFSSSLILLACAPLFDALRSAGSKRAAAILLAPLAVFSVAYLAQLARLWFDPGGLGAAEVLRYGLYFAPKVLVSILPQVQWAPAFGSTTDWGPGFLELGKWCVILTIAI